MADSWRWPDCSRRPCSGASAAPAASTSSCPAPASGAPGERGFNQAAEIAKALSRLCGIAMDAHLAQRVRHTAAQTELPWRERSANMRHAFACARGLAGLRIAVVDDVMTTGATLDEFARTLKQSGAARSRTGSRTDGARV